MSLIWILFVLVYTNSIVVAGKGRGLTIKSPNFEFREKKSSSHSIPFRNYEFGYLRPVKKFSALHSLFYSSTRRQENIGSKCIRKPHVFPTKQKRNHWICTTPSKLLSKSVASTSLPKYGLFKKNIGSITDSKKETLSKSSGSGDTAHYNFVKKRLRKRFIEFPNQRLEPKLDLSLPSNLMKITNSYRKSRKTISTHESHRHKLARDEIFYNQVRNFYLTPDK